MPDDFYRIMVDVDGARHRDDALRTLRDAGFEPEVYTFEHDRERRAQRIEGIRAIHNAIDARKAEAAIDRVVPEPGPPATMPDPGREAPFKGGIFVMGRRRPDLSWDDIMSPKGARKLRAPG